MFGRILAFVYGVVCYAVFFATFLYAIGFIGNLWVPKTLDSAPLLPFGNALAINLGLLALFAVQHSVMARPAFKRIWTKIVPEAVERATYTLFSSIALIVLFWFWQPMGLSIWHVDAPAAQAALWTIYAAGWALVLVSTFLINHFDLFGLRQVWLNLIGKPYTSLRFQTPGAYRFVRHPLYVGWLLVFWATPSMSAAHLLFAVMTTAYILIAIQFEERDLIDALGQDYRDYREQVPMLIPSFRSSTDKGSDATATAA